MSKSLPVVAIVGRANVGKSSLFNRLVGQQQAIVAREAGTTRDSVLARMSIQPTNNDRTKSSSHLSEVQGANEQRKESYMKYDDRVAQSATTQFAKSTSRVFGSAEKSASAMRQDFWLVDTAGLKSPEDEFEASIQNQIEEATDSADLILVVVEAHTAITEEDRRVAKKALKSKKPVILVTNKVDLAKHSDTLWERLGIKQIIATSASQNRGTRGLLEAITSNIPTKASPKPSQSSLKIALLGRPNVGKSSLFNTLAKKQQAIVSSKSGTTRDINRLNIRYKGKDIELLDTAGIRRSGKIERGIEKFSVLRSLQAIEQSDICLLLIDINELATALDQKIAGMISEAGKGLIIVVSKWDSLDDKTPFSRDQIAARLSKDLVFVPWAPLLFTSAITGQNATKIFEMAIEIFNRRQTMIKTTELNRWLGRAVSAHPPASHRVKPKLRYIVQDAISPPTFRIYGSNSRQVHWSYRRYLDRSLREQFDLAGTPIKIYFIDEKTSKPGQEKSTIEN